MELSYMDVISWKDALAAGLSFFFTGRHCSKGHTAPRRVSTGQCQECFEINKAAKSEYHRAYTLANREKQNALSKVWYENNKARALQKVLRRRTAKTKATPDWLSEGDKKNITAIYEMSCRITKCLGIKHHVDHIVPLRGNGVCGLHVPWNLAAIPASLNIRKYNKLPEDL
jgi:hypothetical protein